MKKIELIQQNVDEVIKQIFSIAIDILGGPRKLVEYRRLTWLASLMEAIFVIYLHNEENKSADEIAEFLGISTQTAKAILQSKPEYAKIKLESGESCEKTHIAGGIAKLAYKTWKETQNGK
ncbi:hypothetical protein [Caldicellulosiruptor morganii]|uniref:Regulator n=1 Tax=Caldicellulosiruptor morganii TaxID=1387555 RepID=A0ABY7BKT0_9FIRM|nr:hypothetical protein [Caldicellulosiruptor morganii]WAM32998.1 regulator [Caldicellulosiruptor morganii]